MNGALQTAGSGGEKPLRAASQTHSVTCKTIKVAVETAKDRAVVTRSATASCLGREDGSLGSI